MLGLFGSPVNSAYFAIDILEENKLVSKFKSCLSLQYQQMYVLSQYEN